MSLQRFVDAQEGAYERALAHPLLGPRLAHCAEALLAHEGVDAQRILGSPDDLKLRSSMTLFAQVAPGDSVFRRVLTRYYAGKPDQRTLELLGPVPTLPH